MKRQVELDCDHVPRCANASRHVSVSQTDKWLGEMLAMMAAEMMKPLKEPK